MKINIKHSALHFEHAIIYEFIQVKFFCRCSLDTFPGEKEKERKKTKNFFDSEKCA